MSESTTLAEDLRKIPMGWLWGGVFGAVALAAGITPWDTVAHLVANQGVGQEGATLILFAAALTFPLAIGTAILALYALKATGPPPSGPAMAFGAAGILWLSGEIARSVGLGVPPGEMAGGGTWAPGPFRPLGVVLGAYFSTYGLPWMLVAS